MPHLDGCVHAVVMAGAVLPYFACQYRGRSRSVCESTDISVQGHGSVPSTLWSCFESFFKNCPAQPLLWTWLMGWVNLPTGSELLVHEPWLLPRIRLPSSLSQDPVAVRCVRCFGSISVPSKKSNSEVLSSCINGCPVGQASNETFNLSGQFVTSDVVTTRKHLVFCLEMISNIYGIYGVFVWDPGKFYFGEGTTDR